QPDPPARALGLEHAGLVAENDRGWDVRVGERLDHLRVVLVGVDRRQAEVHLRGGSEAGVARLLRHVEHLGGVVQAVEDPEALDTVLGERADPQLDDRVGGDAHAHHAVAPRARSQNGVGERRSDGVEPLPRVLAVVSDLHLERRAAGEVHHAVARAVDRVGDRQHLARAQAHAPEALLAVAQGLVDELDARHQPITTSGWPYSTASPFSGTIALISPATGATTWFINFITSTMASVSPSATLAPTSTNGGAPGDGARQKRPTLGLSTTVPSGSDS